MTTQTNTKVRLVRCPKCREVLPEPEIPIYRCGGCGAVLKAKRWKTNSEGTGLNHDGSDANGRGNVDSILDEREINGPREDATISARGESLSDSGINRNQDNGLNLETTNSAGGEPLPGIGSSRNQDNCLNEETISATGKSLSDSGNNRNQDNGLNQETTNSATGEPFPGIGSTRKQDNCLNEETVSARGEFLSDIGSNSNQDICPNQETTVSAGEESPPETSNKGNENNFRDYRETRPGAENFSPERPNSLELCSHEDQTLTSESTEKMEEVKHDYHAGQNMKGYENESGDSDRNSTRGRSFSDDFYSSMEFLCHEAEVSSPERTPNMALRQTKNTSDQWDRVDEPEPENCIREQTENSNFLSEVPSPIEGNIRDENDFSSKGRTLEEGGDNICLAQHVGYSNECKFEDRRKEIPRDANSSSTDIVPVMTSPVVDANALVDEDLRVHNFDSLEKKDSPKTEETGSIDADENHSSGSILSDNVESSDDQHLGASQRLIPKGFSQRCTCITDTPENLPLGNSGSDFGLKHRQLSKSPTKCYYGHDGSASSCDGFEDKIAGRFAKPARRKVKHANNNNSNGLHTEDGPQANGYRTENLEMQYKSLLGSVLNEMLSNESDIKYQARKTPILPEKNHPTMKYRTNQDDLHDPRSFGASIGSRMREDREEQFSSLPFIPINLQTGQRKASPPPYPLNSFQHYSSFGSSDAPSYTESGKMELLRVVNELKEELNRMHISNSRFPLTVTQEEKYTPLYYDRHLAPVVETSSDLSYSRYPRKYSQEKGLPQLNQLPRMAFSGDAADYTRHVDYACLHCRPQDWHYSVRLPSHMICCNKVHCMGHSSTCYNSPCSTSSSPHRYKSSEFSVWDRETMSDDQRHRDNGIRNLRLRERYQSMKRHVRPVAGGNPIIACYRCSELLQLPADFLLLGKQCHKLRCNACGKVLKFSLQSGKHIVPCIPDAVAPPPSLVDDSSRSISQRNWVSVSHSNDNPDAEPISCTDDYGISFERSISTEGEPSVLIPPLHPDGRNSRTRKMSSGDTVMTLKDRKMKSVLGEYQKMPTESVENLGTAEPSTKRYKGRMSSSEIKELPANGGSPLHRLMGYSSPSAVMKN